MDSNVANFYIITNINFPTMAESSNSEESLLANESISKQVVPFIPSGIAQEESILPTVAEEGSDIEILEENITKKTLKKKRKSEQSSDFLKFKKLNAQNELSDVCALQISIKSLLKNNEIRKQIAPFIEEVVIDCSDSDLEEKNASTLLARKMNDKLSDEQILDKAKDVIAKSLTKSKKKSKHTKPKNVNNHLTGTSQIAENVHVLDLTADVSDDDVILSDRIKNTQSLTKKSKTKTKKVANSIELNHNPVILENKNLVMDDSIFIIDGLQQQQQTYENIESKHDDIPDLPIIESDDWYYLNMARAPKESSIEDDVLIIQNSLKLNENSNNFEVEEESLPILTTKVEAESSEPATLVPTPIPVPVKDTIKFNTIKDTIKKRRRRRKRKLWSLCKNRQAKNRQARQNIAKVVQNKNIKEKTSINLDNRNQVTNLTNSMVIDSEANNETKDQTTCFENGESYSENITFSHELIPIIKKETESVDTSSSEVPHLNDTNTSINKTDPKDVCSKKNDAFKPMLKPYRVKEITPDFYRDEEKVYKTYKKICEQKNSRTINVQKTSINSKSSGYKCYKDNKKVYRKRCLKCGRKYERPWTLQRHEMTCNSNTTFEKKFECPQCPYKSSWSYLYQAHIAKHLMVEKDIIDYKKHMHVQCTVCFSNRDINQRGTNCTKCHSYCDFLCRICGKDYTTITNLKTHIVRNIQLGYGKTCQKCGKNDFPALCALKNHLRLCGTPEEIKQGKIICNKIPYVRLVRHEEQSKSKESHQMNVHCSNCNTFGSTSERKAKCETCCKDVSYKCELCKEFLSSYSELQSHVLNVHIMNTEMSIEDKNEEDFEGKSDCDEINYSCESDKLLDNIKQSDTEKGDSTNYDSPTKQKCEDSSAIEKSTEKQDIFDKFVENLKEKDKVLLRCEEGGDELADKSEDGIIKDSVSERSEASSIMIHDDKLSDIVNSSVVTDRTLDNHVNEKSLEDRQDVESSALKQKNKINGIKRYCLRCDKTKTDLDVIRIGSKKEICEKCRSELLYQCVKCKRKSTVYSVMMYHWKHYCVHLRPKNSFAVPLTAPEKYNSDKYNRIQRHQCRLCPYSSNLKNRLMLHLQMHSWKDIKRAVLEPKNHSDDSSNSK